MKKQDQTSGSYSENQAVATMHCDKRNEQQATYTDHYFK